MLAVVAASPVTYAYVGQGCFASRTLRRACGAWAWMPQRGRPRHSLPGYVASARGFVKAALAAAGTAATIYAHAFHGAWGGRGHGGNAGPEYVPLYKNVAQLGPRSSITTFTHRNNRTFVSLYWHDCRQVAGLACTLDWVRTTRTHARCTLHTSSEHFSHPAMAAFHFLCFDKKLGKMCGLGMFGMLG